MAPFTTSSLPLDGAQAPQPALTHPTDTTTSASSATVCTRCGGSGRLRINDDSFRTCLDCLGQGVTPRFLPQPSLSEWMAAAPQRSS